MLFTPIDLGEFFGKNLCIFVVRQLPVKMYELLWVGLYGHLPWPSNSSINSKSPDKFFIDNAAATADDESPSVDEAAPAALLSADAAATAIKLSLVVDCASRSNVSSSCDDDPSVLLGPFL